jgi:hypothetical protein
VVLPQDGNWMWCFRGMGIGCGAGMDVVLPQDGNWMWCFDSAAFETRECVAENSMWLPPYLNQLNVQRN